MLLLAQIRRMSVSSCKRKNSNTTTKEPTMERNMDNGSCGNGTRAGRFALADNLRPCGWRQPRANSSPSPNACNARRGSAGGRVSSHTYTLHGRGRGCPEPHRTTAQ